MQIRKLERRSLFPNVEDSAILRTKARLASIAAFLDERPSLVLTALITAPIQFSVDHGYVKA
jgi:hypothetical protein